MDQLYTHTRQNSPMQIGMSLKREREEKSGLNQADVYTSPNRKMVYKMGGVFFFAVKRIKKEYTQNA